MEPVAHTLEEADYDSLISVTWPALANRLRYFRLDVRHKINNKWHLN